MPDQAIDEAKQTTEALKGNGHRSPHTESIRREIEDERERLAVGRGAARKRKEATDVRSKLAAHLPIVAAAALAAGFVLSGGIGATVRLVFRRGREGKTKAASARRPCRPRLSRTCTSATPPPSPGRSDPSEWRDGLRRSFSSFMKDDCMGLAKQVAFSSLLAFFPAVVLLVGLLGLFGAYDQLQRSSARSRRRRGRLIEVAQDTASGQSGSSIAVIVGGVARRLGRQRRDGHDHQGGQPRVRPPGDAAVLGLRGPRSCSCC